MILFNLGYKQANIYDLKMASCLRSLQSYTLATPKKSKNIRVVGSQQKKNTSTFGQSARKPFSFESQHCFTDGLLA